MYVGDVVKNCSGGGAEETTRGLRPVPRHAGRGTARRGFPAALPQRPRVQELFLYGGLVAELLQTQLVLPLPFSSGINTDSFR